MSHNVPSPEAGREKILYDVKLGQRHKVLSVGFEGNKYFGSATIRERLQVLPADILLRYGRYSTGMVSNDTDAITALYQSNGFRDVKVTAQIEDEGAQLGFTGKLAGIRVIYKIEEGAQSKIGKVDITGVDKIPLADIKKLMNTQSAAAVLGGKPGRRPGRDADDLPGAGICECAGGSGAGPGEGQSAGDQHHVQSDGRRSGLHQQRLCDGAALHAAVNGGEPAAGAQGRAAEPDGVD